MTSNPSHPDEERLAARGYRWTAQRAAVLEVLRAEPEQHPDAHAIYQAVRRLLPQVSLGTIYRTLSVLREAGLIRELEYGSEISRYEVVETPHYNIICMECGRIGNIHLAPFADLSNRVAAHTPFEVLGHRLEFYGRCPECQPRDTDHQVG
ncbi:MAG: transcriptional repressor [Ardenticatenaceae bacterium]|nr:transcriptional repressor [Ardenticatenaceae bacterium]